MSDVLRLLDRFISGEDTSLGAANRLEVAIDDAFPDDERAQALVEDLARYRPEGGDFLWDTPEMQRRLRAARDHLAALGL